MKFTCIRRSYILVFNRFYLKSLAIISGLVNHFLWHYEIVVIRGRSITLRDLWYRVLDGYFVWSSNPLITGFVIHNKARAEHHQNESY